MTNNLDNNITELRRLFDDMLEENKLVLRRMTDEASGGAYNISSLRRIIDIILDEVGYLKTEQTFDRLHAIGNGPMATPPYLGAIHSKSARSPYAAPRAVEIDLCGFFGGHNWHQAEWDEPSCREFRWSDGATAGLRREWTAIVLLSLNLKVFAWRLQLHMRMCRSSSMMRYSQPNGWNNLPLAGRWFFRACCRRPRRCQACRIGSGCIAANPCGRAMSTRTREMNGNWGSRDCSSASIPRPHEPRLGKRRKRTLAPSKASPRRRRLDWPSVTGTAAIRCPRNGGSSTLTWDFNVSLRGGAPFSAGESVKLRKSGAGGASDPARAVVENSKPSSASVPGASELGLRVIWRSLVR